MRLLLDTHVLLWALLDNEDKLPKNIISLIEENSNQIFYSDISLWEIAIKHGINPHNMPFTPQEIADSADKSGILELPFKAEAVYAYTTLQRPDSAPRHKDPFDKMLIAQAKAEGNMKFLTHDDLLIDYGESCVLHF